MAKPFASRGTTPPVSTPASWNPARANEFLVDLRAQLRVAGVFRADTGGYVLRAAWVLGVSAAAWIGLLQASHWPQRLAMACLAGYAAVQAAAIGHEAGHGAVSRRRTISRLLGHLFMTGLIGLSFSGWVHRHGMHHVHPNSRHDPDARPGLFNFNEQDARAARGLAGFCTRHQHRLLLPLSTLMAFTLKAASWKHVGRDPGKHLPDLALLSVHGLAWLVIPGVVLGWPAALANFLLVTWSQGAYLSFVFIPNHLGGPTSEEAGDWPPGLRQIVTARNLPNGPFLSHVCVGLNNHIEHHLFGNLSTARLRESRAITRRMCERHGIPYRECGLLEAFAQVQRYNRAMAGFAREAARGRRVATAGAASAGE